MKELFKFGGRTDYGKLTPLITASGLLVVLGVWYLVTTFELVPGTILPGPLKVLGAYKTLLNEYHLLGNIGFSVKTNLMAYFWAILISLPTGLFIATFPINNLVFGRYISAIRFTPLPAISGLFIAIFGLTTQMKEAFLAVGLIIYIIPEIVNRVNDLQNPGNDKDHVLLQTACTLGMTAWQRFRYVYWPYVTSNTSGSIRSLLAISWTYTNIEELFYRSGEVNGLGALISTMLRQAHIAEAWAGLFLIILIGVVQDYIFLQLEKTLFPYNGNSN